MRPTAELGLKTGPGQLGFFKVLHTSEYVLKTSALHLTPVSRDYQRQHRTVLLTLVLPALLHPVIQDSVGKTATKPGLQMLHLKA